MADNLTQEDRLILELTKISCQSAKVDPARASVSISYLVDLLNAVEKYLARFDELMIGAGKMKKEGLDTTGLIPKVQELQTELHMYALLARSRVGGRSI